MQTDTWIHVIEPKILSLVQHMYKWQNMTGHNETAINNGTTENCLLKVLEENIQGIENLSHPFIKRIEEQRKMLSNANISLYIDAWKTAEKRYTVLLQSNDTYMQNIYQFNVPIIKLTILKEPLKKYMVQKYYNMSFDDHHSLDYYHRAIEDIGLNSGDLNKALNSPLPFNYKMLNMKYPMKGVDNDSHITVGFIHVLSDAIVLPEGEVLYTDVQLHPGGCQNGHAPKLTKHSAHKLQFANEVFTISEFWGFGFFHTMIEDVPRIAPYLPFLRRHKEIKIHVMAKTKFTRNILALLGIEEDRLIDGYVRARIIFMPMGTRCGYANIFNIQLLSLYCRRTISHANKDAKTSVVLIKRSAKRFFTHHDQILQQLRLMQMRYNITVEVFADNPLPTFQRSMRMFNSASMVVGPHGAGLSNVIFAKPGTVIIEAICTKAKQGGHANPCYAILSFLLGHIYYGIIPSHDCSQVTKTHLIPPVNHYLHWLQLNKQKTTKNILS